MEELLTKQVDDVLIVYLSGRLDVHLSLEIEQAVNELIDKGHINLLFDLEKVVYLSSSGLRIFIAAMRKLMNWNGQPAGQPDVICEEDLQSCRTDRPFDIYDFR